VETVPLAGIIRLTERRSNSEDLGQYRALLVPVLCSERGNYVHRCLDYSAVWLAIAAGEFAGALRNPSFLPVLLSRALARGHVTCGGALTALISLQNNAR